MSSKDGRDVRIIPDIDTNEERSKQLKIDKISYTANIDNMHFLGLRRFYTPEALYHPPDDHANVDLFDIRDDTARMDIISKMGNVKLIKYLQARMTELLGLQSAVDLQSRKDLDEVQEDFYAFHLLQLLTMVNDDWKREIILDHPPVTLHPDNVITWQAKLLEVNK